ncbi:hypothetical protein FKW77_001124 [Venturia effusa]|uniref:Major facilitator superfamily (MFS) profile domain-containing protein n=1 Tax=Venturia effusa TaxID=50376 RepID=A0A517LES9_9PEZI|nr:hypothetical protein FKW77_001124 [Venturia effusa]
MAERHPTDDEIISMENAKSRKSHEFTSLSVVGGEAERTKNSTSITIKNRQNTTNDGLDISTNEKFAPPATADSEDAITEPSVEPTHEYVVGFKLFLVIAAVTLVVFLMLLDMSIIVTAIPRITSDFHSLSDVGWYGDVFLIAGSALQPLAGKLYTQFSSKLTFLSFLLLFEIGSVLCGAALNSNMLIVGRAVAGLGGSGLVNGALTIVAASIPMHKRPAMIGIIMSFSQIGIVSGPLVGGVLTQYASWRWCFYINLPIGGVAALLIFLIHIPENIVAANVTKRTAKSVLSQLDLVGFFHFAPSTVMFLMALQWGGQKYAWSNAIIIGLLCGGASTLLIFLAWERHAGEKAMVPFSILRNRVVWCSSIVTGLFFGSLLMFSYYLPIYFQTVEGASPTMSGVYMLPSILTQMLAAVLSGVLVGRLGYYTPWAIGSGVVVSIGAGLMSTLKPESPNAKWIGYQILVGLGRGCGIQMPIVACQNVLPPGQIPVGMAVITFAQQFGGGLFLAFGQLVFSHGLVEGLAKFAPSVDANKVIKAGATAVRDVVAKADLRDVLEAYNVSVNDCFYLAAAGSAVTVFASFGMGFGTVKKVEKKKVDGVEV